jgi:tripartite-type tricarboxylate transporter receptor subunit TctC
MRNGLRGLTAVVSFCSILLLGPSVRAEDAAWPTRPIRIVVPSAAGGYDTYARLLAPSLAQRLGQNVFVENRAGAAGNIGMAEVMRTPPDGHTILFAASNAVAVNSSVYKSMTFDPVVDLEPVGVIATVPMVWVTYGSSPFKSLADVVARAKAEPGKLDYANPGNGTLNHLITEAFNQRNGLKMQPITYNGTPPAENDVIATRVPVMVDSLGVAMGHLTEGRMRALAVTTRERSPMAPEVPTVIELGLEEREFTAWYAFLVPKGTPPQIIAKLSAAINATIAEPIVAERIRAMGARTRESNPAETRAFMISERDNWRTVVRAARIELP